MLDTEKVIDEFESKKGVPSSFSDQFILSFVKKLDISEFYACQSES